MKPYSVSAPDLHRSGVENSPSQTSAVGDPADKKVNHGRLKSAYRDAQFRQWFQLVDDLAAAQRAGGTSVTVLLPTTPLMTTKPTSTTSPAHAFTSASTRRSKPKGTSTPDAVLPRTLTLAPGAILSTLAPLPSSSLSPGDQARLDRYWHPFTVPTPGLTQHAYPAPWRDLSDVAKLEWWHRAMSDLGDRCAFTLNLSPDVEAQARSQPSCANWLSKRIARQLSAVLGRKVPFWFTCEMTDRGGPRRLHLHGEFQGAEHELEAARKALRLAGGQWAYARQHQAWTKPNPTLPWVTYSGKGQTLMRKREGRHFRFSRPIDGDWIFATNDLRRHAGDLYAARREAVLTLMNLARR